MTPAMHAARGQPRLQRTGRVVERHGQPVVSFEVPCGAPDGACGCRMAGGNGGIPLAALGDTGARAGDIVILEASARGLTRVAVRLFALPLAALLLGAWLVRVLPVFPPASADVVSGVFGLVCLAVTARVMARDGGAMVGMMGLTATRLRTDR